MSEQPRTPYATIFSVPLDWTGRHCREKGAVIAGGMPDSGITRADLDALDERALRAILGNVAQVANAYPDERTARTLTQQVRFHLSQLPPDTCPACSRPLPGPGVDRCPDCGEALGFGAKITDAVGEEPV